MNTPPSRRIRLQFSLRWLLVLITLGAITLGYYRWQWPAMAHIKTAHDEPESMQVSTYHYGWSGNAIKHGPEQIFRLEIGCGTVNQFSEGEMLAQMTILDGRLVTIRFPDSTVGEQVKSVPSGMAESPENVIIGKWMIGRHFPRIGYLTQRVAWRNAQRHGKSTWLLDGTVIQSAEFDRGRVLKWNDKPVAEEFRRWANERVTDQELRRLLFTVLRDEEDYEFTPVNDLGAVWIPTQPGPPFLMHFGFNAEYSKLPSLWQERFRGRVFGEVLLECALNNWSVLDFRYGCVCTVLMSADQRPWTDPTGSDQVSFEPNSPAEFSWDQLATTDPNLEGVPAARLNDLFRETSIQVDTTAVNHLDPALLASRPLRAVLPHYPRRRRELFGHILFTHGYVCEQQGNVLVIRKRADLQ